ncbi:MAG: ABC transporter substrate-binding protein [Desulfobacteraceae bacterium]|nr:ABC transporter substrate-binding protein [Desulfobacteraceae bacterium]
MKKAASFLITILFICLTTSFAMGSQWDEILEKAKTQKIYFNAWGGGESINDFILQASREAEKKFGFKVVHVKVTDISNVISRILVEKTARRNDKGSVDLMWINGENFRAMKMNKLLYGPFTQNLPNYRYVDIENKPTTLFDFTVPVDNMEAPWGMAQLIFMYDTAKVKSHPSSMKELLGFAKKNPGRVTYPAPPSFHGTTFLKQVLLEVVDNRDVLYKPVSESDFNHVTKPLWKYLDTIHPLMWRKGQVFTSGASEMKQLLNDSEIFISLSFNPNKASNAIIKGELPDSVRTYIHDPGTIGNTHFLAIPFNSSAKEAAMVFADFLLSPEMQAKKADPAVWGDPTVLSIDKLTSKDQEMFSKIPLGLATLSSKELSKVLPEPHASWVQALEKEWKKRYNK